MGKHAADLIPSTQAANPWRATLRTALAVGFAAFLIIPEAVRIVLEVFGETLPPEARAALQGVAALVTLTAAAVTRIMALPGVIELTNKRAPLFAPTSGK